MRGTRHPIRTRSASDGSVRAASASSRTLPTRSASDTPHQSRPPQADQGADLWHGVFPVLFVSAMLFATVAKCHKSAPTTPPDEVPKVDMPAASPPAVEPPPPVRLPDGADAADRWLFVEKAKDGARGGWAAGSFDQPKNKLDIHTRDVRQFVMDVSRIGIDWQRLVVLSIDGKNTELRRRDFSLLHFRLDDHGQWVVVEP